MQTKEKTVSGRKHTKDIRAPKKNNDLKNAYMEINEMKMGLNPELTFVETRKVI
jgi:hypothetical protein